MTTREMQLDFKRKFNKIDSQKNRNILVPEIDLYLNEAAELFVKKVAQPKVNNGLGFETTQRITEDIKSIVMPGTWLPVVNNIISLPPLYLYYIKGKVKITKGNCPAVETKLSIEEHRDEFEESLFYKSSFEWRVVNGIFTSAGIEVFTDGTFTITEAKISYIRKKQGKYLYRWNIQEEQNTEYNGYSYYEVTVWPTLTANKILETCINELWGTDVEAKKLNDYNAALLGILDESYIDIYKDFLQKRKELKEQVDSDFIAYEQMQNESNSEQITAIT